MVCDLPAVEQGSIRVDKRSTPPAAKQPPETKHRPAAHCLANFSKVILALVLLHTQLLKLNLCNNIKTHSISSQFVCSKSKALYPPRKH